MTKLTKILVCLIAVTFIAAPLEASARPQDHPNYGFCKSGKKVNDIKSCKENGGTL